jgi:hypothetical protein
MLFIGNKRSLLWSGLSLSSKIRKLFSSGSQGAWYDPSDFATLFQDSAGTTPVTETGQPVGKMLDKSGSGNHATQSIAASRPILQIDSNGKYYLSFDGINDWMVTSSINFSGTDKMSIVAGVRKLNDSALIILEQAKGVAGAIYLVGGSDAGGIGYTSLGTGSSAASATLIAKSFTYTGADTAVLVITHDIGNDLSTIRRNKVVGANATGDKGVGNFSNNVVYIGARNGSSLFYNGNLYGVIICGGVINATQIGAVESYINSRTGAY